MEIDTLLADIRIENITRHIRWFTEETPNRISSGEDVTKASKYIAECMSSLGLETKNEAYYTYNSSPVQSELEVVEPESLRMKSLPCCHIRSTRPEGETFELIFLEAAAYADIAAYDVRGKMVLVEMSYAPPVPERARILSEAGAAGIVCMNWGNDEDVICNRALKSIWGNPTEDTFPHIPDLVGLGVTRQDGLKLKELCAAGAVKIRATAIATRQWQEVRQPWGVLKGNGGSDEFLLIGSHFDAWEPGVTCNATGNALTLELCRVLSEHRDQLDRDIWFVFWNGHEIAEAAGSTWFLDNHWDAINKKCVCYMHIDSPGLKDATLYEIKASDELRRYAAENAEKVGGIELRVMDLKKIGDQSFMGIGVPSVTQRMSYSPEYLASNHGATLGWWNHTDEDGIDKYDERVMEYDARITLSFLYALAREKVLPYEYAVEFERLRNTVADLQARYGAHIDLDDLERNLQQAAEGTLRLASRRAKLEDPRQIALYNEAVIHVSRTLTNVFQTYAEKYDQDSYGFGKLSAPIPLLADLAKLEISAPDSFAYGLVKTKLVRNKNRIDDALGNIAAMTRLYDKLLAL